VSQESTVETESASGPYGATAPARPFSLSACSLRVPLAQASPILPRKLDEARAFAQETMGAHRTDYDDEQRRAGITRET
jgi:hypothetical protein